MDHESQKQDILDVIDFTDKLLDFLVKQVPQPHSRHYQRVWNGDVRGKVLHVRGLVAQLTDGSKEWQDLDQVGWGPDSARLKSDTIATKAGEGALALTLHLLNSALGSLSKVFAPLEPVKEFKEFLEPWVKGRSEPEPYIQTLFGPGPIPFPASKPQ